MPRNKISYDRQAEIESIIQSLLLSTGLSYPENPLIDIIKAAIPDIVVTESDFSGKTNVRGAVFRKSKDYDRSLIAIQSNQSEPSKTFALAHEFGHYVLDHNPRANYYIDDRPFDGSKPMQDEGEANFFAQMLLMPRDMFAKLDQPFVTDMQLAKRFGVTEGAVRVRREWLNGNGF
jgi:Zn-dependent peptidase ImmA (M78 family)